MAKFSVFDFIRNQLATTPPVPVADLTGKTVVVTGANVGLGFEAAKHFARMNPAKLVIACRSQSKADAALAGKPRSIGMATILM
jgi:retinol dehydrogenase-12